MNCDAIASFYVWIEHAAFGTRLQRHRLAFLDSAEGAHHALILGDGDGRFVASLAARYPALTIDCIELSANMLSLARKRLCGKHRQKVQLVQGNALTTPFPHPCYDVVYSHFFLDCFTPEQISVLADRIVEASGPDTRWVISDFRQAESGWQKVFTAVWISTMYFFFKLATQLEQQQLPDHHGALGAHGFRLREERRSMAGLIVSEYWQR